MPLTTTSFDRRQFLKIGGSVAGIGAATVFLASCGASPTTTSSSTGELTIMTTSPPTGDLLKRQQKIAGDPLGVKLRYVTVQDGTFPSQATAAQQTGNGPDIIQWTSQGAVSLMGAGVQLLALDERIKEEDDDFYQQDYDAGKVGGSVYALGTGVSTRVIAYRGDYADAGGAGEVPDQWSGDEFLQWVTKLGGSGRNAFGWEAKTGDGRGSSNFLPLLWSTGGRIVVENGDEWEVGFTADQLEQVLAFYSDAVYKYGAATKDVGGWGYPETDGGFQKGTLGAYSSGTFVKGVVGKYPDTLDNLRAAPLPNLGTPTTFWEQGGLMISAASKQQDLAWSYIELIRSKELQDANATDPTFGGLSVRQSSNDLITDPILKTLAAAMPSAQVPEPVDAHIFMDAVMYPAMQQVTINNTAPGTAAKDAVAAMESVMPQINGS